MTTSQSQSRIASRSGRNALGVGAHGGLEEPNQVRAGAEGLDKPAPQQELSSSPAEEKPKWEKREIRWKQRSPYNGCDVPTFPLRVQSNGADEAGLGRE